MTKCITIMIISILKTGRQTEFNLYFQQLKPFMFWKVSVLNLYWLFLFFSYAGKKMEGKQKKRSSAQLRGGRRAETKELAEKQDLILCIWMVRRTMWQNLF